MSMWLSVVSLSSPAFSVVQKNPALLKDIFFNEDKKVIGSLGLASADRAGVDYLSLSEALSAMAEAMGDGDGEPDFMETSTLGYDAGYGPAMVIKPTSLAKALKSDVWDLAAEMDEDLKKLLQEAKKRKHFIIALVS